MLEEIANSVRVYQSGQNIIIDSIQVTLLSSSPLDSTIVIALLIQSLKLLFIGNQEDQFLKIIKITNYFSNYSIPYNYIPRVSTRASILPMKLRRTCGTVGRFELSSDQVSISLKLAGDGWGLATPWQYQIYWLCYMFLQM